MKIQLLSEALNTISSEKARSGNFFGPVYHGSSQEKLAVIRKRGFEIFKGEAGQDGLSHGYPDEQYGGTGHSPPIHHLGFGIYFTTSRSKAKRFNHGSVRGLTPFFLDAPRLETINFAAQNTMMKWWLENGYNPDEAGSRLKATENMTRELSSKYDAVWFKGKTLYSVLDGDQICVYDPSKIYMLDDSGASGFDIGSVVVHSGKQPRSDHVFVPEEGMKGKVVNKSPIPLDRWDDELTAKMGLSSEDKNWISVKWRKGGTESNYTESDLEPVK
jgi:hypothetical protein